MKVFVFDNGAYSGTRISYPTATAGKTDLAGMARAAGINHAGTVRDIEGFKQEGIEPLNEDTLRFVVCKVEESLEHRKIPRPNFDPFENAGEEMADEHFHPATISIMRDATASVSPACVTCAKTPSREDSESRLRN